jgi:hypothetical protein
MRVPHPYSSSYLSNSSPKTFLIVPTSQLVRREEGVGRRMRSWDLGERGMRAPHLLGSDEALIGALFSKFRDPKRGDRSSDENLARDAFFRERPFSIKRESSLQRTQGDMEPPAEARTT